ncbi:MAG: D-glycero-D-manno-heptose 1,7-bisphosphate phosphatase [Salibacteraceae bacterium]|jgi:D-glycero-D-manno-heptose 1,7-bisphosphate phosphatase|tara:strand:- start:494 stop:976 length:483 start_codon:yes stop_codon:yes gene_type:complete
MRKIVFLDRDGVVNIERGYYTWKVDDFEFTQNLFEALGNFSKKGYSFVIITNQGGIAKGLYGHEDVLRLNIIIAKEFENHNLELLDIYYSPYHSDFSKSLSRKPDSLMLEKAIDRYGIDVSKSYMIGDSERDILAAQKVGVKGILIAANSSLTLILDQIK